MAKQTEVTAKVARWSGGVGTTLEPIGNTAEVRGVVFRLSTGVEVEVVLSEPRPGVLEVRSGQGGTLLIRPAGAMNVVWIQPEAD